MHKIREQMMEAVEFIRKKSNGFKPDVGMILGSGLGPMADEIEDEVEIHYEDIPHMKTSSVKGHSGKLVMGSLEGKKVMAFRGRLHFYEGHSMKDIAFPVRLMQGMGVKYMVITNACGGIKDGMNVGELMIIKDHINLMGDNPLKGINDDRLGDRFPDMSNVYDRELQKFAKQAFIESGVRPTFGVYAAVPGPNYETYAETRYIKAIGADAIGMSTVPEVIVAAHAGIKVVGVSCVTDVIHEPGVQVTHEEVLEVTERVKPTFKKIMRIIISKLPAKTPA